LITIVHTIEHNSLFHVTTKCYVILPQLLPYLHLFQHNIWLYGTVLINWVYQYLDISR